MEMKDQIKIAKARVAARRQIDGFWAALKQLGIDLGEAKAKEWRDVEDLKKLLDKEITELEKRLTKVENYLLVSLIAIFAVLMIVGYLYLIIVDLLRNIKNRHTYDKL